MLLKVRHKQALVGLLTEDALQLLLLPVSSICMQQSSLQLLF